MGLHRRLELRHRLLLRPPERRDDADRHRRGLADPRLFDRLHEGRRELRALLRVSQPVPVLHAAAGARPVAAGDLRRLGRRRARLLPADRILVRRPGQGRRGQEGVHHQPHRRRRLPARHVPDLPHARHAGHGPRQRCLQRAGDACSVGEPGGRAAVHRRDGQERADPVCTSGCRTRWPARRRCRH